MAANNGQRKSSSFLSVFGPFKKKGKGGCHESHDGVTKPWPSDEDRGHFGPAVPGIDMKAEAFIAQCRKRIFESELIKLDPAAADATAEEEEFHEVGVVYSARHNIRRCTC